MRDVFRWFSIVMALALRGAAAEAEPCGGKFAAADQMLDTAFARYGTLYAGGSDYPDWIVPGMGADIDLWRLWNGLPDLAFRAAGRFDPNQDWGGDYTGFGGQTQDLNWLLHVAAREGDRPMPLVARYMVARYLNALIGPGPYAGWWFDPETGGGFPLAEAVRAEAKPFSLMEWLLVIQAQSDSPKAVDWGNPYESCNFDRTNVALHAFWQVRDLAASRAEVGGLAWEAVSALLSPPKGAVAQTCDDTAAEHARNAVIAWSLLAEKTLYDPSLELLDALPKGMRRQAMVHLAQANLSCYYCNRDRDTVLAELTARAPDADFAAWLSIGRSLQAGSVDALVAAQTPGSADWDLSAILNTLSLDDLTTFQARAVLPNDLRQKLWKVIAARAFVLGRSPEARAALSHLDKTWPAIGEALSGPGGEAVQVARAIIVTPGASTWATNWEDWWDDATSWRQFDLPRFAQTGGELEETLKAWTSSGSAIWRASDRGRGGAAPPPPIISPSGRVVDDRPIARLVAFDELGQFGRCNGLLYHLNAVLIPWAGDQAAWWRFADREQVAATLGQLARMNRWRQGVTLDRKPAAQQAFALLRGPYAHTDASRAARYWYFDDIGCKG